MTDSKPNTTNPIFAQATADVDRERRRRAGDWDGFAYKFTLTKAQEKHLRVRCNEWGLNFDVEWRTYNDLFDLAKGETPKQRKAEDTWYPRRTEPRQVYTGFTGWLEGRYYYRKFNGS